MRKGNEYKYAKHQRKVLGWPKVSLGFFCKIKDTFFIVTNNFIDLDILSMSLSLVWYNVDCSQCVHLIAINFNWSPRRWGIVQREISSTATFDTVSQSQHLLHTQHKSFFALHCVFTFLDIIKHNMPKMLCIFFHLQY